MSVNPCDLDDRIIQSGPARGRTFQEVLRKTWYAYYRDYVVGLKPKENPSAEEIILRYYILNRQSRL